MKKASEMRAGLDDRSKKWTTVKTAAHCDRIDWDLLVRWLHTDEASHEDNTHKAPVRIDLGVDLKNNKHLYEFHVARTYSDTKLSLYGKFLVSPVFKEMTEKYQQKKVALRLVQARFRARKSAGAGAAGERGSGRGRG